MAIGAITSTEFTPSPLGSTTRTLAVPPGTANTDLLVAYCAFSQDETDVTDVTVDSGTWVRYQFPPAGGVVGRTIVLIRQWATGDPTSYLFTKVGGDSSGNFAALLIKVPGAIQTPAVVPVGTDQAAPSVNVSCPAVDVPAGLADQALVLRFYHNYYYSPTKPNTDTWAPPPGFAEVADQSDDWISVGIAALLRGSGTEDPANAVSAGSQSGATGRGVSMVLAPAAVAAGPEPGRRMHMAI